MDAVLVFEHRFKKDNNDFIYSSSNSVSTLLWERYLTEFDHLIVVARIEEVNEIIDTRYLVSHGRVSFIQIPYYVGPKGFVKNFFKIRKVIYSCVSPKRAYICRLPKYFREYINKKIKKRKLPYVVEVVADPWEVFAPGGLKNSFSKIHRYRSYFALKNNVKHATGVIYVTEYMLQKRYPANKYAITTHASNVILKSDFIAQKPKIFSTNRQILKLISIGSLDQLYKSPDIVLDAVKKLISEGLNVSLIWLGGGIYQDDMLELAKKYGIGERVVFKGNVSSEEVALELESSDLYIHVSRTEGLPRALIEAMAKGLPGIGSRVGGIPELLDEAALVDKNDAQALTDKIIYFIENTELMNELAKNNLAKAEEYEFTTLAKRRSLVYRSLKKAHK